MLAWWRLTEGRKGGVHLALALQDPTHKSLDLRIRRNCTPVFFRVKDGDASRVVLGAGGSESLPDRQFMAVIGSLVRGVGFGPDDDDILRFLSARPVPALPAPEWLEGAPPEAPKGNTNGNRETQELAEQIRPAWEQGESKRAMARGIGKEYAGAFAGKLDAAIGWLEDATTTS